MPLSRSSRSASHGFKHQQLKRGVAIWLLPSARSSPRPPRNLDQICGCGCHPLALGDVSILGTAGCTPSPAGNQHGPGWCIYLNRKAVEKPHDDDEWFILGHSSFPGDVGVRHISSVEGPPSRATPSKCSPTTNAGCRLFGRQGLVVYLLILREERRGG